MAIIANMQRQISCGKLANALLTKTLKLSSARNSLSGDLGSRMSKTLHENKSQTVNPTPSALALIAGTQKHPVGQEQLPRNT